MRRLILALYLFGMVAFVALLVGERPAGAAFSGVNGKIAFRSERKGNYDIFVMNTDGTEQTNLTNDAAFDVAPAWSPDGSKIAFESARGGGLDVWIMNADGAGMMNLSANPSKDVIPVWSPDGSQIAFISARDGNNEVYVMNADGSSQTRVTSNPANDIYPAWSPDGTKIGFHRDMGAAMNDVFVIDVDGSNEMQLTNDAADDRNAAWSPDGSTIAFDTSRDGNYEIYTMNSDGSNETRLLADPGLDLSPEYSPDGMKIVFASLRGDNVDIYSMNADGSNVIRLTTDPAVDQAPNWQALHDTDLDGCYDTQESGPDQVVGGLRDLESFWDFFDTPNASNVRDRAVSGLDFFAVLGRFGAIGSTMIDPLSAAAPPPAYHTAFDRRSPVPGADPWDSGPPDGALSGTDFFALLAQFGHSCG